MAIQVGHKLCNTARHTEIARRYSWQAKQQRKRYGEKPDKNRLITLIRLRELERVFQSRYGRFLPDDDAGMDDLLVAAHHIAFLRGDVVKHIVAWARAWAPWLPPDKAEQLAQRVAAEPRKFTADALAWRLRLSMVERTSLKITTIGALDLSKAERKEERKRRDREAKRAMRAENRSGRPRGRPRKTALKNASAAVKDSIAVDGFSDQARAAPEALKTKNHDVLANRASARLISTNNLEVKKYKSRIPASLRPTKAQIDFAMESGFDRARAKNLFEHFHNHHLAIGSYAVDWAEMWESWICTAVDRDYEQNRKARAQAYLDKSFRAAIMNTKRPSTRGHRRRVSGSV
jgi:hypothetical protein